MVQQQGQVTEGSCERGVGISAQNPEGISAPRCHDAAEAAARCTHCGLCTHRCEVLSQPGLDIGKVEAAFQSLEALPEDQRLTAVTELMAQDPALYHALRTCCFCGYCTADCPESLQSVPAMREWRELFSQSNLMPPQDSRMVMMDEEWNIFSAYRAIYGIGYPEYTSLAEAAQHGPGLADTLFFPGCSLASYLPELVRSVGQWLSDASISWALSLDCCGSPLMSAGLFDRAEAFAQSLEAQIEAAGIQRVLTVCPGCGEELAARFGDKVAIVGLPELMEEVTRARLAAQEPTGFNPLPLTAVTIFDSCHDREEGRHGQALRRLLADVLPDCDLREMAHHGKETLCCGAGGAVSSYDPTLSGQRAQRILDEAQATGAGNLVTYCPTCTYTFAQTLLGQPSNELIDLHYLEILFGVRVDWAAIFNQLESMWTGEYGPWLQATFF